MHDWKYLTLFKESVSESDELHPIVKEDVVLAITLCSF